jgi:hypothetical protein
MKAWILTLIEIAGICATYFFCCWLFGDEPTIGGYALAVATIALLGVTRLKLGTKQ